MDGFLVNPAFAQAFGLQNLVQQRFKVIGDGADKVNGQIVNPWVTHHMNIQKAMKSFSDYLTNIRFVHVFGEEAGKGGEIDIHIRFVVRTLKNTLFG